MSIIQNKEIYDPSQGNPFEPIEKFLDMLDKQILDTTKTMQGLEGAIKGINQASSGKEAQQLTTTIGKLNTETGKLNDLNANRKKIDDQIAKAQQKLISLNTKENKELVELRLRIQERNAELKKQARFNKSAVGSITELNQKLGQLRKQYDNLSKEERENLKVGGNLLRQIQALDAETKQLTATTGRFQKNVGNYPKLFGNTTLSLKGLGTELLAAGGVVGGVQLLVQGFRAFTDQVGKNIEVTKQLNASFGLGAEQARRYAGNILAIADTFDQDYNEVAQAAISVSKQLGIDVNEATSLIEEGFLKGSNNSGEFLDILKEYPAQFAAVGIDADQAFAIINKQVTEGIYSDKGVDAIKEGGLRLRENTKAVQDALAPLDESIKKQIEQEVAAGKSFEAIKLVSEALNDTSLTAEETQKIIADVFGGPGEDAGLRYLQTLKDIDENLDNVSVSASESEQSTLNLSKAWNQVVAGVSDSEGIFQQTFTVFKNLLAGAVNSLALLIDKVNGSDSALTKLNQTIAKLKQTQADQASAEIANKKAIEATEAANEKKRKERFAAWQARQQVIERENAKRILESTKRIDAINKQIEKSEEEATINEEAVFAELDLITETEDQRNEIEKAGADIRTNIKGKEAQDEIDILEEKEKQRKAILAESVEFAGEIFGKLIADGKLTFENFGRLVIGTALDITEKIIQLAIAEITAKQIAEKGFLGIATSAALIGIVRGVFSGIKSKVLNFAEGTEYVHGAGTETSDSIPSMLSKGERVVPASVNKLLNGASNEDLPSLVSAGMLATSYNNQLMDVMIENNTIGYQMLGALKKAKYSFSRNGMKYIIHADGSNDESFKE